MATHNQHHYLPAAYFKSWCGADGRLKYFTYKDGKPIAGLAHRKHITKALNLYSVFGAPDAKIQQIEKDFFSPLIDTPGAKIHEKLLLKNNEPLSKEERHLWVKYILALRARTPEAVEKIRVLSKEMIEQVLLDSQEEYESIRPLGAPGTLRECIESWFIENIGVLRVLPSVIEIETTRNALLDMHWVCFDVTKSGGEFITSDRPLTWHKSPQDEDFFLALPLSPSLGFVIAKSAITLEKLSSLNRLELVSRFNESTISNSKNYVYSACGYEDNLIFNKISKSPTK
jgi:hypothetical protein